VVWVFVSVGSGKRLVESPSRSLIPAVADGSNALKIGDLTALLVQNEPRGRNPLPDWNHSVHIAKSDQNGLATAAQQRRRAAKVSVRIQGIEGRILNIPNFAHSASQDQTRRGFLKESEKKSGEHR